MVALALAAGIISVSVARHVRLPGIVILLGVGVMLGPDGVGILDPEALGHALPTLVEFAVAVILFEGGLNLEWGRLRREGSTINRLVTYGALITAVGGMAAAYWILQWDLRMSVLFGSLVVVTGPTVITPILRRIRVTRKLNTVLEAEGVFIDAVGAIFAVVALEVALSPSGSSVASGLLGFASRMLLGTAMGLAGGWIIMFLLRFRGVVPEGLENVFTLSLVLALFQASDAIMSETGIIAAIVAGLVVGNGKTVVHRELKEFKEQLTVMFIGMLFVLLAADVRVRDVIGLGWPGVWVVLTLMLVVRPVNVIACTMRAGMTWREKAFMSWLAPRGIVAAAVASLFYNRLSATGIEGGVELRALVFLVIAMTVVIQGGTGPIVAQLLGVRRPSGQGYAILGANGVGRALARLLTDAGEEVVLIDANAEACKAAQKEGFRVVFGNALEERAMLGAEIESRKGAIGVLQNEAVNLLFAERTRGEYKVPKVYVAVDTGFGSIEPDRVIKAGARVLFGRECDIEMWDSRARRGLTRVERWEKVAAPETAGDADDKEKSRDRGKILLPRDVQTSLVPLFVRTGGGVEFVDDTTRVSDGEQIDWLVHTETAQRASEWLTSEGWRLVEEVTDDQKAE